MNRPYFSVIIPTKNRPQLLLEAINSVINQSFSDFEIIVIDDGDQFEIKKMIRELNSIKIRYYQNHGRERSAARNTGISFAYGQYICFLDDDDLYEKDFLIDFYNYHSNNSENESTILRTGFKKIFEPKKNTKLSSNYNALIHNNPVNFCLYNMCTAVCLCFPKEVFISCCFNEELCVWEDTEFVVRCLKDYRFVQLKSHNYIYRIYQDMGSRKTENLVQLAILNVENISNFFKAQSWIKNSIENNTLSFLKAEKYIQYSLKSKKFSEKFHLLCLSLKNGIFLRLWKYYLLSFTPGYKK